MLTILVVSGINSYVIILPLEHLPFIMFVSKAAGPWYFRKPFPIGYNY